jgi:hypothetical protein
MADGIVQVAPDSTGKKIDSSEITVGANLVERQRIVIASDSAAGALATVAQPGGDGEAATDYCLATESYLKAFNGTTWDRVRMFSAGGLQVAPQPAPTATTGAIASASTTIGPITMGQYDGATVVISGTHAGINFGFWGSNDNTIWYPINAAQTDTGVIGSTTGVITSNATRAWDVDLGESLYFKIVSTAWTSGSGAINIALGMFASAPAPSVVAQGPAANAAAVLGNPVLMGGSDATNVRNIKTDTAGNLTTVIMDTAGTNKATVKAASTAAAAADTALVVAISPNNTVSKPPATLAVTATAAANTAVTLTLPAPGAGLFHYITRIEITRTATAALAGTATLSVTTTNLPGTLAWSFGNAMAAGGTQWDLQADLTHPLKSSVANTATTIVLPAPGAAVLWRATAFYYTAA